MITKKLFRVTMQNLLRRMRLLKPVEAARFHIKNWNLRKRNKRFIRENPGFVLPPAHLAFDAYSSSHWEFYKISGELTAKFLAGIIAKHFPPGHPPATIYEWGCGPARVIRQMPAVLQGPVELHASDYNEETIDWCKKNMPGIEFIVNGLHPPLPYAGNKFDFIYAISVFTHLSEASCLEWANEIHRILRPGGIALLTTSGDAIYEKELLPGERKKYETDGIVVRGNYQEGKKMFLAMHSPKYVREKLLRQFEILEHGTSGIPFMRQDWWVVRKKLAT